jgi:hypothetical protein
MKTLRLFLLAAAVAAVQCANPSSGTGSSTESRVAGMLYKPDGSAAASAKVCFYHHHDDPRNSHAVDSTTTDTHGNYSKGLDTGTYNILATLDTNATFQDSIVVAEHDTTRPPTDTLRARGSIQGMVHLAEGGDPRPAFVLFMGSNTFAAVSDSDGNFSSTGMAKGKYQVMIFTMKTDYKVLDTSFTITAGTTDSLTQPIVLQYTGIPIPSGLAIIYDTLRQIVNLSWNKPATGRPLNGYNIYRKHQDSAQILLKGDWQDTAYSDSTGIQDITYEYRVAAVDTSTMEGTRSGAVSVTIINGFRVSDTILTARGNINAIDIDSKGNYVVVSFIQPYAAPAKVERYDSLGNSLNYWDIPSGIEASYTYNNIVVDDSDFIYVVNVANQVIKFDSAGNNLNQFQVSGTVRGFAIHGDTLYIGNTAQHTIMAYTTRGDSLFSWGSDGSGDGQFQNIVSLACDPMGRVYVEDILNEGRIQVFDRSGSFINSYNFTKFAFTGSWAIAGQMDISDSTILVTDGNIYGFGVNGTLQWRAFTEAFIPVRTFFYLSANIKVALMTGEVVSLTRK